MQYLTPRDLGRMKDDQCFYVPVVNQNGGMLNDPVALRPSEGRWWISIADSDLLFWVMGLAFYHGGTFGHPTLLSSVMFMDAVGCVTCFGCCF